MNLKKLFGICEHKWKVIRVEDIGIYPTGKKRIIGVLYHLKCKKCGKIKLIEHQIELK